MKAGVFLFYVLEKLRSRSSDLFFFGCLLTVIGLPLSKFLISISVFVIAGSWLLSGQIKEGFVRFRNNKVALLLTSLYFLHLLGLLWTSNFSDAVNDLRVKLPLLLLPFLLSATPAMESRKIRIIFEVFCAAVLLSVLYSFLVYLGFTKKEILDIRDISRFVSHIRLSLMICLAIAVHAYLWKESAFKLKLYRIISVALYLVFLLLTGSVTGIIVLASVILLYVLWKVQRRTRMTLGGSMIIIIVALSYYALEHFRHYLDPVPEDLSTLETHTIQGNPYDHYIDNDDMENGRRVYLYISWPELETEWRNRSELDFEGKDKKGQELKYTLVRYMTAIGVRKDAEGFDKLSDADISNIEKGITNPLYKNYGLKARIHQVLWELSHYKRGNDPTGHSVSMRLEFWKNGVAVFKDAPVIGVGTGDFKKALHDKYVERKTMLPEKWRLRSHNQYLTFALTFGVMGLTLFLVTLFYPLAIKKSLLYSAFVLISGLSMLTEDTLETQAGVTFYAFFNSFFLFQWKREENTEIKD